MSHRFIEQLGEVVHLILHGSDKAVGEQPNSLPDRTTNENVSSSEYEYGPLDIGDSYIRLLELLPGTRQDDIDCRLIECRLEEHHGTYEALSYVWGDTKELTPIRVNGKTLMIGKNLRSALFNIRKADEPRVIWADAVCINQSKVAERNHQVSHMDRIYRSAVRTIVWLGDDVPGKTDKAYHMLESMATMALSRRESGLDLRAAQEPPFLNNLTLSLLNSKVLESPLYEKYRDDQTIIHLACSKWWVRAWTIQEILLASQAVVVAGRYSIDWERFCTAIDYGLAIGIWNPVNLGLIIDPVVVPYISMHALRARRRLSQSPILSSAAIAQSLLEMLIHCRFRQATDPRDKINSLLGLAYSNQSQSLRGSVLGIEADYAMSASDVFGHATRQLILQSGNLDVLGACLTPTTLDIPSWVPDWTVRDHAPRPLMHDALGPPRHTHATGVGSDKDSQPRFLEEGRVLLLSGYEVTTVMEVAPRLDRLINDEPKIEPVKLGDTLALRLAALPQILSNLGVLYNMLACIVPHLGVFADWEEFARSVPPTNPQPLPPAPGDESDPLAIYWQTLSAGALAPEGRAETARLFYAWRANLKPISRLHRWQIDRFSRPVALVGYISCTWRRYAEFAQFLEMAYERRLGRGEDGFLALLPAATEVGDKITLVKGGRVPLVVRPGKSKGEYTFVGEAYVHGIMDGETFDPSKCVEMRIY